MENILIVLAGYIIGSISFAYLIGMIFYKTDVSKLGSGNLGATNVFRNLGKKAGIAVIVLDAAKGSFAVFLPHLLHSNLHPLIVGAAAIVGHSLSIFMRFKGGKSVATTAGMILAYQPLVLLAGLIVFLIVLKISKYVSLSSMIAALAASIVSFFFKDIWLSTILCLVWLFLVYKHRENIVRIKNKTESKVKWI